MYKSARIISKAVYSIGVAVFICLACIALFGSGQIANPDAMLPLTWKELAFIWLSFGTIPMLIACMAMYKFNEVNNSTHKKRNFFLIFLPGFVCSGCALYSIGLLIAGMVNSFLLG